MNEKDSTKKIHEETAAEAEKAFEKALDSAWNTYQDALGEAFKAMNEAERTMKEAEKALDKVLDKAANIYKQATGPTWEAYKKAVDEAVKAYNDAKFRNSSG
jgi:cation transport regulator ChaB